MSTLQTTSPFLMKKRKIIIENLSHLSDIDVMRMVGVVIDIGRISSDDTAYCPATMFDPSTNITIYTTKNKTSDTFKVVTTHHPTIA